MSSSHGGARRNAGRRPRSPDPDEDHPRKRRVITISGELNVHIFCC